MKDATGELSMTAIAVVAIAAIGVVFTQLVWPAIKTNITRSAHCSEAFNCSCPTGSNKAKTLCTCYYLESETGSSTKSVKCPNQDASV